MTARNGYSEMQYRLLELTCERDRLRGELANMTTYKNQIDHERKTLLEAYSRIPRWLRWLLNLLRWNR